MSEANPAGSSLNVNAPLSPSTETDLIDVLEASPIGAAILDNRDQVLFWNSPLLAILGGLQEGAFAEAATRAFFKEKEDFNAAKEMVARLGLVTGFETRVVRADDADAWASVTIRPMRFEGRPATLVWYYDITDAHHRRAALEQSLGTLLEVLDTAPFGAALCDGPGRVSYWNTALIELVGVDGDTEASDLVRTLILHADAAIDRNGQGFPDSFGAMDKEPKWIASWRRDLKFEGRPATLFWFYDVTDLRTAQAEAERAVRTQGAFLATMSHEIRTPMNGVRTLAELLSETPLSPDQANMVVTIRDSADALVRVINEILDFSKIEAGKLEIDLRPFRMERMVESSVALLRPKAEEKGIKLRFSIHAGASSWRLGDEMRLRQILLNMIGNAIKFTHHGEVAVHVVADGDTVRFEIRDTGIGMDPDVVPTLFQPFAQAEASTARRFGGTGLGLSICKGLIELMGGMIGVDSRAGEGSTFWFVLDLPGAEAPPQESEEAKNARAQRWIPPARAEAEAAAAVVLCAEDNATNRDVLARVLDRLGIVFDMSENGADALRRLDRRRHGLVLTDGHMPEMDGWELSRAIRAQESEQGLPLLPIVTLTADAVRGIEQKCVEAGMQAYLTKPLVVDLIDAAIMKYLPATGALRTMADSRIESGRTLFGVESNILDLATLTDLVGDEFEVLDEMLQNFLSSAETLVVNTLDAMAAVDARALRQAAHALKGASRYVGAKKLADAAAVIEDSALANRLDDARRWCPTLRPLLDEIAAAVEKIRVEEQLRRIRQDIGELATTNRGMRAGLDLETVVGITETAADRILHAAETILSRVDRFGSSDEAGAIQNAVMSIFEACSFQDLTSQRVRKAIARLSEIEEKLDAVVRAGANLQTEAPAGEQIQDQGDIDKMFSGSAAD